MRVFDSSAVLALTFGEPGAELAAQLMDQHDALISSVNHAELLGKLLDRGLSADDGAAISQQLPLKLMPFTAEQAQLAAGLWPATRALVLLNGDRSDLVLDPEASTHYRVDLLVNTISSTVESAAVARGQGASLMLRGSASAVASAAVLGHFGQPKRGPAD